MSEPVLHVLHYAAPIPVGHRVELTFYSREDGLFKVVHLEQRDMPVVLDVETGIEYAPVWLFKLDPQEIQHDSSRALELSPRVQPTRSITGRVVACRVVTGFVNAEWNIFTYLTVRAEDGRVYR